MRVSYNPSRINKNWKTINLFGSAVNALIKQLACSILLCCVAATSLLSGYFSGKTVSMLSGIAMLPMAVIPPLYFLMNTVVGLWAAKVVTLKVFDRLGGHDLLQEVYSKNFITKSTEVYKNMTSSPGKIISVSSSSSTQ